MDHRPTIWGQFHLLTCRVGFCKGNNRQGRKQFKLLTMNHKRGVPWSAASHSSHPAPPLRETLCSPLIGQLLRQVSPLSWVGRPCTLLQLNHGWQLKPIFLFSHPSVPPVDWVESWRWALAAPSHRFPLPAPTDQQAGSAASSRWASTFSPGHGSDIYKHRIKLNVLVGIAKKRASMRTCSLSWECQARSGLMPPWLRTLPRETVHSDQQAFNRHVSGESLFTLSNFYIIDYSQDYWSLGSELCIG